MIRRAAIVAILVTMAAGCTGNDDAPALASDTQLQRQATDVLARWDSNVAESPRKPAYAPAYDVEMLHDSAQILGGRPLVLSTELSSDLPAIGLRWPDGTTRAAAGLTASQAFDELVRFAEASPCPACSAAHVTGVHLITRALDAVAGPVTVPAWEFTFAEYPDHAIVPAVGPDEVLLPQPATANTATSLVGLTPDRAWTFPTGRRILVEFTGVADRATTPCGIDYTVDPVYSDSAIVLIIHEHPYQPSPGQPGRPMRCHEPEATHVMGVDLPQPVGERVLLDVRWGRRIPTVRSVE